MCVFTICDTIWLSALDAACVHISVPTAGINMQDGWVRVKVHRHSEVSVSNLAFKAIRRPTVNELNRLS